MKWIPLRNIFHNREVVKRVGLILWIYVKVSLILAMFRLVFDNRTNIDAMRIIYAGF